MLAKNRLPDQVDVAYGPQAIISSISLSMPVPGRAERTICKIASTTWSPTGSCRTRRCATISSLVERMVVSLRLIPFCTTAASKLVKRLSVRL